jgi:PmbA protein
VKSSHFDDQLQYVAEQALNLMHVQGFKGVQVSASLTRNSELSISINKANLLRSVETQKITLTGLIDGRKASAEFGGFDINDLRDCVTDLFPDAMAAPQDFANAVSSGQRACLNQGPLHSDLSLLVDKVSELLEFRAMETPSVIVDEGFVAHTLMQCRTLTSGGTDLQYNLGWYSLGAFGIGRDGTRSSSFNVARGSCNDLHSCLASDLFGIGDMLRDTEKQIYTQPIGKGFLGDVVLAPQAVMALLGWFFTQIGDASLISGSSLFYSKVGDVISSPMLNVRSRFDAPGVIGVSEDAFLTPPVELIREGKLMTLTPSFYASRKLNLPHVPVAPSGWELLAGETSRNQMISDVTHGALVGRLSMGNPAPNGDFAGVIKNSFEIKGGVIGHSLSEVMISGNILRMLGDVLSVSRERLDTGSFVLPWLRVGNLHFS